MKAKLPLVVLAALIALAGCKTENPQAGVFRKAAAAVKKAQLVETPTNGSALESAIALLGGFPSEAESATSKKGVDSQFAIGYDGAGKPVVVVSLDDGGVATVVTDSDVVAGYEAKFHRLAGAKLSSENKSGGAQEAGDGARAATEGGGRLDRDGYAHGVPKGCPFHVGDSKAHCKKIIGGEPEIIMNAGGPDESWVTGALSQEVVGDAKSEAIGAATAPLGMFGSTLAGRAVSHSGVNTRTSYTLYFGGPGGVLSGARVYKYN